MRKLALTALYLAVVALTACGQGTAGDQTTPPPPAGGYARVITHGQTLDTQLYGATMRAWFDSHKRYPFSACQRGEEGIVKLRFQVDRLGRVVDYTLLTSSGYADLDQSVDQMMRGAQLPPFPAGMTQPEIKVSVRIRFGCANPANPGHAYVLA
jgi:periplasmic protein TonB